jgi:cell division protein FtsQ
MGTMPRLAQIKLNGGLQGDDVKVSGKSLMMGVAGVVMFTGVAIAGATWLGSSLFDVREAFARTADGAAANIGFDIDQIEVAGVAGARAQEVRAIVVPDGRRSILSLDPNDVRARVESLDWVADAQVRRLWPSTLQIQVERRQAYARWQENGVMSVIDANGERLQAERAANHRDLPLVVGAGAGPAAEPLLIALENLPEVRSRLRALVRVGERRWNLELQSGTRVALPQDNPTAALAELESLQARHALLDRPLAEIDLRAPGRMSVRVHPELAGGPMLGGA